VGAGTDQPAAPSLSLPKGGGAIRGIGEKFGANPVTGTGSLTVPIAASPGRSGFGPQLALAYDSGAGNGPFGLGWHLSAPAITRKTDKGLPLYEDDRESDVFLLSDAEDLVPTLVRRGDDWERDEFEVTRGGATFRVQRYRPRVEGAFARIERWRDAATGETHWRTISRENLSSLYGDSPASRIADPENPARVFSWLLARSWDDRGNVAVYEYKPEDREGVPDALHERHRSAVANRYCKRILYGNAQPYDPQGPARPCDWHFQLVFDYGEHGAATPRPEEEAVWPSRPDAFSTYRAGFEVRTHRLCRRVLMFHHFPELGEEPCLVRSTDFTYDETPLHSRLVAVTQTGYLRNPEDGGYRICDPQTGEALSPRSLPALEMEYSVARIDDRLRRVERESVENLPAGADGGRYQWIDLDGEGLPGILTEQANAWFYKRNVSALPREEGVTAAHFEPLEWVASKPSLANLGGGRQHFMDLAGDGHLSLVQLARPMAGFYERLPDEGWLPFQPFEHEPNLDWDNPNLKMIDLDGDGHADVLVSEDDVFTWYPSRVRDGFGPAQRVPRPLDEERGPALVFADRSETVFLADLSGDGLIDLVRIRNGEVCYWPNLGYGHFGAKVTMDHSPVLDYADQFDPRRIRLADVDGSGTTDVIYLGADGVRIYFNQSGNGWSAARSLPQLPITGPLDAVTVVDLLGNGTACLVWSSPLTGEARSPLRYVDLMGGTKPHLLIATRNNLGAETRIHYAPSTRFYLADRAAGTPWITRLPFPVHVVERVEVFDRIGGNHFVTRYAYHHGHFDGVEREFRGFGMVEQWDTEEFSTLGPDTAGATNWDAASHVPPMLTRTWFHTGVFFARGRVSRQFEHEYYQEQGLSDAEGRAMLLDDTVLPAGLATPQAREACRALKGSILRQEIYALDGTEAAGRPYSVSERNYTLQLLQPRGDNCHAVFFAHPRETVDFHYERKLFPIGCRELADPRVTHSFVLLVDDYGNVLQSAAVGYGRRHDDSDPVLTAEDRKEQKRLRITATENRFTNPVLEDDAYRTPLPSEARTYEVLKLTPVACHPEVTNLFRWEEMRRGLERAGDGRHDLPYEHVNARGAVEEHPYRRLIEQKRTLYRRDDLNGPLPLGRVEPRALPFESVSLALTLGLVVQVYGDRVTEAMLEKEGGYRHSEGDENWWIPSGEIFYSPRDGDSPERELAHARRHFFLPHRFRDPFGHSATVTYDAHDLMIQETRDALGNRTTTGERDPAENLIASGLDYRVLQPRLLMDANRNRATVAFDVLGMVMGTAVQGKPEENLGDSLEGFAADLPPAVIAAHLRDPFADPHGILKRATTRLVYDLFAYQRTRDDAQPQGPVVHTLARETHDSDLAPGQETKIQLSFSYSNGFGREIQKKMQAEPGPVEENGPEVNPRWVGSGWTIFNNKGKPVRQYEPFFTATHRFELARKVGVSPILCYDPAGRVVATLHPNHTWEKVVFDPWRQETWDVNDTVLLDPREDPDVGGFFVRLPEGDYLPTWYAERAGGALGRREEDAARKTAVHAGTPTVASFDTLGRPFLTVAHNRFLRDGVAVDERFATRVLLDIEGNQRAVVDAKGRVVMRYDYDILSTDIHKASMEAGERWNLNEVTGKPLYAWDSRGHQLRTAYDPLRRPNGSFLREGAGSELLVGHTVYGESRPIPEAANLRDKVIEVFDQAGVVISDEYDFKGNPLHSHRRLAKEYKTTLDWSATVPLEAVTYTNRTLYDALNRPTELTTADQSVIRPSYNEANLLERVEANLRGAAVATPFVTNVDYDAKGQRLRVDYGNGARTSYIYDSLTFRLVHIRTRREAAQFPNDCLQPCPVGWPGCEVQNVHCNYDPVGNVTHIRDYAQQNIYFSNRLVEPSSDYTYDALYRLIEATGREHLGQAGAPSHSSYNDYPRVGHVLADSDGSAMGRYLERYVYDEVGNFQKIIHRGTDPANPGWTSFYAYHEPSLLEPGKQSNRLTHTTSGGTTDTYSTGGTGYDAHGNMLRMPQLHFMQWDFKDQMKMTQRQVVNTTDTDGAQRQGERTWYAYDAGGQRMRKVTELANGQIKDERIYLGGVEFYRKHGVNPLLRETLHMMHDKQRIALVETRIQGTEPDVPEQLIRYQFGNHLGSASLELDGRAEIISYEEYFPYGSTSYQAVRNQTDAPKRYRYTGKERDEESGLDFYGARYYAAWLHRFISVDPMAERYLGQSSYGYAANNPTTLVDVRGEFPGEPETARALAKIDQLSKNLLASEFFPHVMPAEFTEQLKDRVLNPDALNQGKNTDFCWAAACMSYAYGTNPEGMVDAMFSLYTTGKFSYSTGSGDLSLTPTRKARRAVGSDTFKNNTDNQTNKENSGLAGNKVDQMLFMTLASTKNFKSPLNILELRYKPGRQESGLWAGRTFGATVRLWKAFEFSEKAEGSSLSLNRLFHSPTSSRVTKLGLASSSVPELEKGNEIVLFVYGPLFRRYAGDQKEREKTNKARETTGTHFIRVRNIEQDKNTGSWSLEYWDYGHKDWRKTDPLSTQQLRYITHGLIYLKSKH